MDMDFPHPRKAVMAGERKADFKSLIASATARQATSRTVSAMLSPDAAVRDRRDFMGGRIAFFALAEPGKRRQCASGAFWMDGADNVSDASAKIELPVNLEGSTKGNANARETVMPALQDTKWGTEL
jgi:hypothetical protein